MCMKRRARVQAPLNNGARTNLSRSVPNLSELHYATKVVVRLPRPFGGRSALAFSAAAVVPFFYPFGSTQFLSKYRLWGVPRSRENRTLFSEFVTL